MKDCDSAARTVRQPDQPFGGLHVVTLQDFLQHQPVGGKPLFRKRAQYPSAQPGSSRIVSKKKKEEEEFTAKELGGQQVWEKFDRVCILTEQHRFTTGTPDGSKLYEMVKMLRSGAELTYDQVEKMCEDLNQQVVTPEEMRRLLDHNPKVRDRHPLHLLYFRILHMPLHTGPLLAPQNNKGAEYQAGTTPCGADRAPHGHVEKPRPMLKPSSQIEQGADRGDRASSEP
jgi:hypothetical protein